MSQAPSPEYVLPGGFVRPLYVDALWDLSAPRAPLIARSAPARSRIGQAGPDRMRGTARAESMSGLGGPDVISGLGGAIVLADDHEVVRKGLHRAARG